MRIFLISFFLLFFSSCATILNQPHIKATIYTTTPSKIVFNRDTFTTKNNKVDINLKRQNEKINIIAISENSTKTIVLKPHNSFYYWLNAYPTPIFWTGFLIDKNNPKRYTYPKRIFIQSRDSFSRYFTYELGNRKNAYYFNVSLPHINSFLLRPVNEKTKTNTGFWGVSFGIDYYYKQNQYLNLSFAGVSDFFLPVPAAVDLSGEYELMSSRYIAFSNNKRIRNFSFGYGLSYATNTWDLKYYDRFDPLPPTREPVTKRNNTIGLIFNSYYNFGRNFNLGLIYRPTFIRLNTKPKFQYEHLISIDLAWKIRLNKSK